MQKHNRLKRLTLILLALGALCMSFTLLTNNFLGTMQMDDFLKGVGIAFIISSLFVQRKLERRENA